METALAELNAVLGDIDGQTRAGGSRSVGTVTSVRAADVLPATRSDETADIEDLVYIANFEGDAGYAILGADDRLATVIAITEQGSLTPEEFAAVARGEQSVEGDIPPVFPDVVNYAMGLGGGGLGGGTGIGGGGGATIIPPFTDIDTGGYPPPMPTYDRYGEWTMKTRQIPLVFVKWNQGLPYNLYCPPVGVLDHGYVGCTAVAAGQILAANVWQNKCIMTEYIGGCYVDWPLIISAMSDASVNNKLHGFRGLYPYDRSPKALAVAKFLWQSVLRWPCNTMLMAVLRIRTARF